jgi:prevent-host-death family protein
MAKTVSATEFTKNFGRYQDEALAGEPVWVTSHGRPIGAFLSARDAELFERLKQRQREVLIVGKLPEDLVAAIREAEYGADPA